MLDFRPRSSDLYLPRSRLLDVMPDEPGHAVWLEAPYGYGKSVLASQWADRLETEGWRVAWIALYDRPPAAAVAQVLELPDTAPWPVLLDSLWNEPTLLVVEDIEALEDHSLLSPLLTDVRGLLLLASRGSIANAGLTGIARQGRLHRLAADDLAFTEEEALGLFADEDRARSLRRLLSGWPLPLHFAALTGGLPDGASLTRGMRESLTAEAWREALLLAAVPYLPESAATPATEQLAESGFVQHVAAGLRLHSLVAEQLRDSAAAEVAAVVAAEAGRLPPVLRGEAFERTGNMQGMAALLEILDGQPWREAPDAYVRWDELLGAPVSARRHVCVGCALGNLDRHEEAAARIQEGLAPGELGPEEELFAYGNLAWCFAMAAPDRIDEAIRSGRRLLDHVEPERAGSFLQNASAAYGLVGRQQEAVAEHENALAYLPGDNPARAGIRVNLALSRMLLGGDLKSCLDELRELLPVLPASQPDAVAALARNVGMISWWLGDAEGAREHLSRALSAARTNPLVALRAEAALARFDRDAAALARAMTVAEAWGVPHVADDVAHHAIELLDMPRAAAVYDRLAAPVLATASYAIRLREAGQADEGLALLDEALTRDHNLTHLLYLRSARYRLTRAPADLDAFMSVSATGAGTLPGFVPLAELPRDRPELSLFYPLSEVMTSGWREAVELRLAEVPPLQLTLLGGMSVRVFGTELPLAERNRQLLLLLELGLDREAAAAVLWPDLDESRRRNNLNVQLSALRRVLEPWELPTYISSDGLTHTESDLASLLAALATGDADEVAAIYGGPLAPQIHLDPVDEERQRLHGRVIDLLASAGDPLHATRATELDPLNEAALRVLLRDLIANGHRWEAERRYRDFAELLAADLGVEPEDETRAIIAPG